MLALYELRLLTPCTRLMIKFMADLLTSVSMCVTMTIETLQRCLQICCWFLLLAMSHWGIFRNVILPVFQCSCLETNGVSAKSLSGPALFCFDTCKVFEKGAFKFIAVQNITKKVIMSNDELAGFTWCFFSAFYTPKYASKCTIVVYGNTH